MPGVSWSLSLPLSLCVPLERVPCDVFYGYPQCVHDQAPYFPCHFFPLPTSHLFSVTVHVAGVLWPEDHRNLSQTAVDERLDSVYCGLLVFQSLLHTGE